MSMVETVGPYAQALDLIMTEGNFNEFKRNDNKVIRGYNVGLLFEHVTDIQKMTQAQKQSEYKKKIDRFCCSFLLFRGAKMQESQINAWKEKSKTKEWIRLPGIVCATANLYTALCSMQLNFKDKQN